MRRRSSSRHSPCSRRATPPHSPHPHVHVVSLSPPPSATPTPSHPLPPIRPHQALPRSPHGLESTPSYLRKSIRTTRRSGEPADPTAEDADADAPGGAPASDDYEAAMSQRNLMRARFLANCPGERARREKIVCQLRAVADAIRHAARIMQRTRMPSPHNPSALGGCDRSSQSLSSPPCYHPATNPCQRGSPRDWISSRGAPRDWISSRGSPRDWISSRGAPRDWISSRGSPRDWISSPQALSSR